MSRFQLIFTGIFLVCAVVGVVIFAVARSKGSQSAPQLSLWGTLPSDTVSSFIAKVATDNRDAVNIVYTQKAPGQFESDLVAALARGQGPDLVLLPQDLIVKQLDKFYEIPFQSYSERLFKDSFIEGSELYLSSTGVIALPLSVDPIVMYWNRDIFSNAGVSLPPTSWTELYTLAPKIIQKDQNGNILQALVAFGSTRNISHPKDVVAMLALQAGTPIVSRTASGAFKSSLADGGTGLVPAEQAVNFFTGFSDPVKPAYSWNRSLASDKSMFLSGKLALYFGYASEISGIRAANPNLNFDVAVVPQVEGKKLTFGAMDGIAILKASPNITAAYTAAATLTSQAAQSQWIALSGYPPVRRDLLAAAPGTAYQTVFYQSALMAHAWLDPYRESSDDIFARMIENVTSGKLRTSESVRAASIELDALFRTNI